MSVLFSGIPTEGNSFVGPRTPADAPSTDETEYSECTHHGDARRADFL